MKWIMLLLICLISCASISSGTITKKEYSTRVVYHDQLSVYPAYHRTIIYGGWVIYYEDDGQTAECQVSETVYNIMNEGDYFDCEALGIDARELWLRLRGM